MRDGVERKRIGTGGMRWLLALAAALPAGAAVTNVRVLETTATQAVLAYTAPDAAACSVAVSESAAHSPVVYDVDGAKFANAALDSRDGNLVRGRDRTFVAGKRAAGKALDNRFYSRALQANTLHYFRITCGSETAAGTFRTSNIPLGLTYPEPYPADPNNPGQYAWPNQHLDQQQEDFIDPQTGALVHRMTGAGTILRDPLGPYANNGAFDDSGSTNPWSTTASALPATYSANGSATPTKLFIALDAAAISATAFPSSYASEYTHLTSVKVRVTGSATGSAASDRSVTLCLTADGVNCVAATAQPTLDLGVCGSGCDAGNTTDKALDYWFTGAVPSFNHVDIGARSTTVSYDNATGAVVRSAGSLFGEQWKTGTRVRIGTTSYRFTSFTDVQNAMLPAGLGAGNKTLTNQNFGVLLWKTNNTAGSSATVTNVQYTFGVAYALSFWDQAGQEQCHPQLLERGGSGHWGYHCVMQGISGNFFLAWIDKDTADTRMLGQLVTYTQTDAGGNGWSGMSYFGFATFDRDDPNSMYVTRSDQNGKTVLVKATYSGDNSGMANNAVSYNTPGSWSSLVNLTPYNPSGTHYDLETLITAFDPAYDPARFGCGINHMTPGGKIAIVCSAGQDYVPGGWYVIFDPTVTPDATHNPVIAAAPTASRGEERSNMLRWGVYHSGSSGDEGWALLGINPVPGFGNDSGSLFQTTLAQAIATTSATTVYTAGEPGAGAWDIARVGDVIQIDSEYLKITDKPASTQWTVTRGYKGTTPATHAPNATVYMVSGSMAEHGSNGTWWNWAADPHGLNAGGDTVKPDTPYFGSGAHGVYKDGRYTLIYQGGDCTTRMGDGSYTCAATKAGSFPDMFGRPADTFQSVYLPFAGKRSQTMGYESHMSRAQWWAALEWEKDWVIDSHPLLDGSGFGGSVSKIGGTAQLYKGTRSWNRKHVPAFGMCGTRPLVDVSAPGSILQDGTAGAYTMCIPSAAGECRSGSSTSDVYINCPHLATTSCGSGDGDPCVFEGLSITGVPVVQRLTSQTDRSGNFTTRVLARAPERWRRQWLSYTSNGKALPGGEWVLYLARWVDNQRSDYYAVKVPPFPVSDAVDRSTFVPVTVQVSSVPPGTANVIAEFGYDTNFYCTPRREACVAAGTGQVNESAPFWWASESVAGLACAAGCTLTIPALPQRVVYYRLKYRSEGGAVLATGPARVAVTR